jgi:hypothetical protein
MRELDQLLRRTNNVSDTVAHVGDGVGLRGGSRNGQLGFSASRRNRDWLTSPFLVYPPVLAYMRAE